MRVSPSIHLPWLFALLCTATPVHAAEPGLRALFAPLTLPVAPSATRSAGGVPGPAYWQNRADYRIDAAIEPATHVLRATETITYTNNSPDALSVLWLQLDQNMYRRDARETAKPGREARPADQYTKGDELGAISVEMQGRATVPQMTVSDTRLQLRLATPLSAHRKIVLHIAYHYTVPGAWGGRTAVITTPDGPLYEIAQWFPRMAVYDDVRGWDTAPYLGSEFYLEYGDIDYAVTVPAGWLVAGSGALGNPQEVLTVEERANLAHAAASDTTMFIRGPDRVGRPGVVGSRTWRLHMDNTRDVAFVASPALVWDAARINLPNGAHALAQSVYPRASVGRAKWGRSTEFVKFAIEYFSKTWFAYPWPSMINVGGFDAGMEYPGIVFDDQNAVGKNLFWISTHEVGHSWFPMIVGSDERRDAWMDEGMNTFIDVGASDAFDNGEFAPKRDSEYAPGGGNPADEIGKLLADPAMPPILTHADAIAEPYRHPVSYFKPAFGLVLLRDAILGPDRFVAAFRHYIAAWAYKHPTPSDFFRLMASDGGEDLSWFWRGWFDENVPVDLAIDHADYVDHTPAHGLAITITARGGLVLPASIEVRYSDGGMARFTLPVEAFLQGAHATTVLPTDRAVSRVTVDPNHALPDADRSNNQATPH